MHKFASFFERKEHGWDMNKVIKTRRGFKNPSTYEELMETYDIDEKGTNISAEVFNPGAFWPEDFYTELGAYQMIRNKERKH